MEGLIILIVMMLVSRLFSGNEKEQKKKQKPTSAMPPFSNDKPLSTPVEKYSRPERKKAAVEVKSLEDFAQEVFGQLQQKSQQSETPKKVEPTAVTVPVPVPNRPRSDASNRPKFEPRKDTVRSGLQERKELGADRTIIQMSKKKQAGAITVPTTRQELVQSIVMAEVLGQPKAKRPNRV